MARIREQRFVMAEVFFWCWNEWMADEPYMRSASLAVSCPVKATPFAVTACPRFWVRNWVY